jgi:hypothetical protein
MLSYKGGFAYIAFCPMFLHRLLHVASMIFAGMLLLAGGAAAGIYLDADTKAPGVTPKCARN